MVASIVMWSMRDSKDDIDAYQSYATQESSFSLMVNYVDFFTESPDNGLYALGNDEDVRRMAEYIRLGYKMIEVFIEHDKTTVFTYIDAAYNTPKHKCLIMEIPEGVSPKNAPVSKMKPRRPVALDDDQIHVEDDKTIENETANGNSDGDTSECSEHDEFVDTDNELVDVKVDMDHFDTSNAKTMGNVGTLEFKIIKNLILALIHSIETRRELYLKKNDKVGVKAACRGTIPVFTTSCDIGQSQVVESSQTQGGESSQTPKWTKAKIANSKVSKLQDSETWQVKTFDDTHKCLQSRKIKYYDGDFLLEDIIDQIETNPEIPIKVIQEQLQRKFLLEVSRMKAFREKAKTKVVDHVRGDFTLQYKQLRDYVMELQQSNPNTTVRIRVESETNHMKETRILKRIYVCLGAAKEGFKACMRQFLGFDGTFMKGPFLGKMLTAVGVEPNNGIYPLAYGIVETESRESWTWFLQHLKEDLDLQDNSNFTFISDRQKGIIPAIAELFSAAEYRYCLRHILENRKLRLETWRQVYSHHINPIKGKIMWPKSPIPTTILPLNHQSTVCRPSLKIRTENKSAGQGHNKRSCIGPRKDAGNKGSTSNACKKRPRSETTIGTS
ncbi:mutator type transposase [Tanacetum coccineum]